MGTMKYSTKSGTTLEWHLDGDIVRWNSNNRSPFDDVLKELVEAGDITAAQMKASQVAREADADAFFAEYIKARANRTPDQIAEERFEARAAHGPGVKLVDIITGESFYT